MAIRAALFCFGARARQRRFRETAVVPVSGGVQDVWDGAFACRRGPLTTFSAAKFGSFFTNLLCNGLSTETTKSPLIEHFELRRRQLSLRGTLSSEFLIVGALEALLT